MPSTGTVKSIYADINKSFTGQVYPIETVYIQGPRGIKLLLWVDDTSIQVHSIEDEQTSAKLINLGRSPVIFDYHINYR